MFINRRANLVCNKLKAQNLSSLTFVLKELQKSKKTPSTSLHTTASKRNQQSKQKDNVQVQTPQTSYRSRLQLTQRNEWIDLINQKSQQNLQSDQIAITEYRTKVQMDSFFQNDWKQPYYKQEKIKQIIQKVNQYQSIDDIDSWKQVVYQRLYQRIS
ncbi:unnamed protein product (macronuclear) [Paramecium tetraurelia]|uniref:Uncharacterized protein n=1 Tax=Paramecium tetraurelia TaxID=5888 RepID=A0CT52_PARTE|nr:uncharacterized protein GSPATT00010202001 [Paramecium tetraurelia]CAK73969.1 unnamed protein product [Paramecium tetraurelia]|eukprot:XP_001441366.1 hypothetical protein (macronuclear) [Paramecium tetraurelia strain d4-2]